jgi:hypothetical protein
VSGPGRVVVGIGISFIILVVWDLFSSRGFEE